MTTAVVPGARFADGGGNAFTVLTVTDVAANVMFDGGWPLALRLTEAAKWTALTPALALAA
jgi:hypothetical protein